MRDDAALIWSLDGEWAASCFGVAPRRSRRDQLKRIAFIIACIVFIGAPLLILIASQAHPTDAMASHCTASSGTYHTCPDIPTNQLPADTAVVPTLTPTLEVMITAISEDSAGYATEFRICTNPGDCNGSTVFSSGFINDGTLDGEDSTWVTPLLNNSTTYYWQARATDYETTTAYSPLWSFTTNSSNQPPDPPDLDFPAPGATLTDSTPRLEATYVDPDSADLGILTFELCSNVTCTGGSDPLQSGTSAADIDEGSPGYWTPTIALADGTYWWRAQAEDDQSNIGPWSATQSFTIATPNIAPDVPLLSQPGQGATTADTTPALRAHFADTDFADTGTLHFELCTVPMSLGNSCVGAGGSVVDSGSSPAGLVNGSDGSWTSGALAPGTYHWHAQAEDDNAATSAWSDSFLIVIAPVTAIESGPTRAISPWQATITWTTDARSTSEVHWGTAPEASYAAYPNHEVPLASYAEEHSVTVRASTPATYYYRVRSVDEAGNEVVSSERSFTVDQNDGVPLDLPQTDGATSSTKRVGDTLYMVGDFDRVGTPVGMLSQVDSTTGDHTDGQPLVHPSLTVGGSNPYLYDAVPDGAGGHFVAGTIGRVGAYTRLSVARLLPDGGVDPDWGVDTNGTVRALARFDDTLYMVGAFTQVNGQSRNQVAAVDVDTGTVLPFTVPSLVGGATLYATAVTSDTLYFTGNLSSVGGQARSGAAAVDRITGAVQPFAPTIGTSSTASSILVAGDSVYIGRVSTANGAPRDGVSRFEADYGAPMAFDAQVTGGTVNDMELFEGRLFLAGRFSSVGGAARGGLASVDPVTGAVDGWDTPVDYSGLGLPAVEGLVFAEGNLYISGLFDDVNGTARPHGLAAVDPDTGAVLPWAPQRNRGTVYSSAPGRILIGGGPVVGRNIVFRSNAAAVDVPTASVTAWDPDLNGDGNVVEEFGGTVYVGGDFTTVNGGLARSRAAAFNDTDGTATGWDPDIDHGASEGVVQDLVVTGSSAFLAGNFDGINGGPARPLLLEVDLAGGGVTTFDAGLPGGANDAIGDIEIDGTRIYAVGTFASVNGGTVRDGAAAFDITSAADQGWAPTFSAAVEWLAAVEVTASDVYVAGNFDEVNGGAPRFNLAAFDKATGIERAWTADAEDTVGALAQTSAALIATGTFTAISGVPGYGKSFVDYTTGDAHGWYMAEADNGATYAQDIEVGCASGHVTLSGGVTSPSGLPTATPSTFAIDADCGAPGTNLPPRTPVLVSPADGHDSTTSALSLSALFLDPNPTDTGTIHFELCDVAPSVGQSCAAAGGTVAASGTSIVGVENEDEGEWTPPTLPTGTYHWRARSEDAGGLFGSWSHARELNVDATLTITTPPSHNIAPHQITITWKTSTSSSTEVYWDTVSHAGGDPGDYAESSAWSDPAGGSHSRTLTGLEAGQTYYYRVQSTDLFANAVYSAEGSFTVPAWDNVTPSDTLVTDGAVNDVAVAADGTVYFGGEFTEIAPRRGHASSVTSTTGALAQEDAPQVNGQVYAAAPDGEGGMYIGGYFSQVGGYVRNNVARLLPDGGVDPDWNPSTNATVRAIEVDFTTGIVYLGGNFTDINGGTPRTRLAAVNANTGLATSWSPSANAMVMDLAVDAANDRVYIGGQFDSIDSTGRENAAAVQLSDGDLLPWDPDASNTVSSVELGPGGVYLGGSFSTLNGGTVRNHLAQVNTTTGAVTAWHGDTDDSVRDIAYNSVRGELVAVGIFTTVNGGTARPYAAAFDDSSAIETGWAPAPAGAVEAVAVDPTGSTIMLGGTFTDLGGDDAYRFAGAVDAATAAPTGWQPRPNGRVAVIGYDPVNDEYLVGGQQTSTGPATQRRGAAAIDGDDGTLLSWDPELDGAVHVLELDAANSQILLGGSFSTVNGGTPRSNAAAVNLSDGTANAWDPDPDGAVSAIAFTSGGAAFLGGVFTTVNGAVTRNRVASVNRTDGTVNAWDAELVGTRVDALAVDEVNSQLYIGGAFTAIDTATPRNNLAGTNLTDGTPTAWDPDADWGVETLSYHAGSDTVYAGGYFGTVNGGTLRSFGAAFNSSDGTATAWDAGADDEVNGFLVDETTGDLLISGHFGDMDALPDAATVAEVDASTGVPLPGWRPDIENASGTAIAGSCTNGNVYVANQGVVAAGVSFFGLMTFHKGGDYTCPAGPPPLTISVDAATLDLGTLLIGDDGTGSSTITVETSHPAGYTLSANDEDDSWGADCACGAQVPDWTGTGPTPTLWTAGTSGFTGVTVRDVTGTVDDRLAKWGTANSSGWPETDFSNNLYAGLDNSVSDALHTTSTATPGGGDDVIVSYRTNVGAAQLAGGYEAEFTFTATANP